MDSAIAVRTNADHITFTDGRHAWWVLPDVARGFQALYDRPCGTCGGNRTIISGSWMAPCENTCQACIDGRHTFEIEVQPPGFWSSEEQARYGITPCDSPDCCAPHPRTLRVSIVEGMVLPIVGDGELIGNSSYIENSNGGLEVVLWAWVGPDEDQHKPTVIDLPPAAEPGMWAVKLRVDA